MRVYLVRHAEAGPGRAGRPARAHARGVGRRPRPGHRLVARGARPAVVADEPAARAPGRRPASSVASLRCEVEADERLAPGATADVLRVVVADRGAEVVVVGHQPDCGRIAAELSGGAEPSFPPGGLAVLEL